MWTNTWLRGNGFFLAHFVVSWAAPWFSAKLTSLLLCCVDGCNWPAEAEAAEAAAGLTSTLLKSHLCLFSPLPGWDVLGEIKRLLLGEQFTQFITHVWKHLIQQEKFKHIHQNVSRAALQSGACGKLLLENKTQRVKGKKPKAVSQLSAFYYLNPWMREGSRAQVTLVLLVLAGSFRSVSWAADLISVWIVERAESSLPTRPKSPHQILRLCPWRTASGEPLLVSCPLNFPSKQ